MSNEPSSTKRVPSGVPTGGQFAASARTEASVSLTGDAPDTRQALIAAMREHLADRDYAVTMEDRLRAAIPALAATGAIDDIGFKRQIVYPLMTAVSRDDTETVEDLTARLADLEAADQAYLDSGWAPPGVDITDRDNMYGAHHTGSLYDSTRPLAEVTKAMRADIKEAQAAGYLPADLSYRVTIDSGGGAINIAIEGMPDERAFWRNPDSEYKNPGADFHTQPSWEAIRLRNRLDGIGAAYAHSQSSALHNDYSNVSHFVFTTVESEASALWREHEKEKSALRRRMAKEAGSMATNVALREEYERVMDRQGAERLARRESDRFKWNW